MTMLIAGHETTAAVLTWAAFLLAQVWTDVDFFIVYGGEIWVVHIASFHQTFPLLLHYLDAYQFANCRTQPK